MNSYKLRNTAVSLVWVLLAFLPVELNAQGNSDIPDPLPDTYEEKWGYFPNFPGRSGKWVYDEDRDEYRRIPYSEAEYWYDRYYEAPYDLSKVEISLGDVVMVQDGIPQGQDPGAPGNAYNGTPAIVIGIQHDAYVLAFNQSDSEPRVRSWYEKDFANDGVGFPWCDRVAHFGQSALVVDRSTVSKYVDSCGSLEITSQDGRTGFFYSEQGWNCPVFLGTPVDTQYHAEIRLQGMLSHSGWLHRPLISLPSMPSRWQLRRFMSSIRSLIAYGNGRRLGIIVDESHSWAIVPEDWYGVASFSEVLLREGYGRDVKAIFFGREGGCGGNSSTGVCTTTAVLSAPSAYKRALDAFAEYIHTTQGGVIRRLDHGQQESGYAIFFDGGFCFELPVGVDWTGMTGQSYRIAGFWSFINPYNNSCDGTGFIAGDGRNGGGAYDFFPSVGGSGGTGNLAGAGTGGAGILGRTSCPGCAGCNSVWSNNVEYKRSGHLKAPIVVFSCEGD